MFCLKYPDLAKNLIGPDSIRRKSSRPETLCGKSHIPWDVFYAIPVPPGSKNNFKIDLLTDFRDLGYSGFFPIIPTLRCSLFCIIDSYEWLTLSTSGVINWRLGVITVIFIAGASG